jgi:hypothetical protein
MGVSTYSIIGAGMRTFCVTTFVTVLECGYNQTFGCRPDELVCGTAGTIHPEDRGHSSRALQEVPPSYQVHSNGTRACHKDGQLLLGESTVSGPAV